MDSEDEPFGYNSDDDPDYVHNSDEDSQNEMSGDEMTTRNEDEMTQRLEVAENLDIEEEVEGDVTNKRKVRMRIKKVEEWKASKRVKKTLSGKEHISKSGKIIKEKSIKPGCFPCKKKCTEKINQNSRLDIFNNYWDESKSWEMKRQCILTQVESKPARRSRPKDGSRGDQRKQSIKYYLIVNGEKINVCKVFFLNTFGISETVVRNALKKQIAGGFAQTDMRGRHTPTNKLPEHVLNGIRSHIRSFPKYPSHYSREKTSREFLGSDLNQKKMYTLYTLKCEEEGVPRRETAKFWAYKRVFQSEFNLSFKSPSTDTCDKCDHLKLQLEEPSLEEEVKSKVKQEYDDHLEDASKRYEKKREDKETSRSGDNTKVVMLDLQKCLPTPYLSNSQSFYLLKLWTLNLTIYDSTEKHAYCMLWDESQAGRGGNEISSALCKWAETVLANSGIENLIIWSDNCPCQNRNVMMMMNYFWLLNKCPSLKTITHKFLLRGHTHLEADHVHGLIERTLKKQPTMAIVTPWDWQQLIRTSGVTVYNMNVEDFKNYEVLYSNQGAPFINRKLNADKESFLISSVVWLEARVSAPGIIYYKTDFTQENFKTVNLKRKQRKESIDCPRELPAIRNTPKGVPKKKHDHLMILLQWVPLQFHDFYRNIPVSGRDEEDDQDE